MSVFNSRLTADMNVVSLRLSQIICIAQPEQLWAEYLLCVCVNTLGFVSFKDQFNIKCVWNLCKNEKQNIGDCDRIENEQTPWGAK